MPGGRAGARYRVKRVEREVAMHTGGLALGKMKTESAAELVADDTHPFEREDVEQRD